MEKNVAWEICLKENVIWEICIKENVIWEICIKENVVRERPIWESSLRQKNREMPSSLNPGKCPSITEAENNFNLGLVIFFDKDVLLLVEDEGLASADAASATSTGGPDGLARQG